MSYLIQRQGDRGRLPLFPPIDTIVSRTGMIIADALVLAVTWAKLARERKQDVVSAVYGQSLGRVLLRDGKFSICFTRHYHALIIS